MEMNKSVTIVLCVFCICFFSTFWILGLSNMKLTITHKIEANSELSNIFKSIENIQYNTNQNYDLEDYTNMINKIEKECGSTQIVKEYRSQDWSTFHPLGDKNYIKLEDCLKLKPKSYVTIKEWQGDHYKTIN